MKYKVIGNKKIIEVREVLTAVWQLYQRISQTEQKCLKTQERTRFLDLAMKYKVIGNPKIIEVREVSTAVWQLYQQISQTEQKCFKTQGRTHLDLAI